MANFLDALEAACKQQPVLGSTIELATNVFETTTSASSTPSTTPSKPAAKSPAAAASPSLATGAIIGIVVGALSGLGLLVFLMYLHLRKRRQMPGPPTRWDRPAEMYGGEVKEFVAKGGGDGKVYTYTVPVEMGGENSGAPVELEAGGVAAGRKGPRVKVG
jgi:hypothetical protein